MRPPCEIVVKNVLPMIRAMLVKELMDRYHLNQIDTARRLGITQPAVSQYRRMLRGAKQKAFLSKNVKKDISRLADKIVRDRLKRKYIIDRYCSICKSMKRKKLICSLHMKAVPYLKKENCRVCSTSIFRT